jgi:purine-binding chemotaxis protein CheW
VSKSAVVAEAGMHVPAATQWVVFSCSDRRFGFPLERVFEIMTPRPFTRLPGAGSDVCGLVGLRGRVVTVFDLGVVLGMRAASSVPDHRLLLIDLGERRIGAAVDDVIAIAPALLEAANEDSADSFAPGAVLGMGRSEDADFIALDPGPLLLARLQA